MAHISTTHSPILQSTAQLLILPTSSDGRILDPILNRCKTLFPENYQRYQQVCRDGSLSVGSCLLTKRKLEQSGLGVNGSGVKPMYLANITTTDHAYHPVRQLWLNNALNDLYPKLYNLVRYEGLRRIALLARPLLAHRHEANTDTIVAASVTTPSQSLENQTPAADSRVPLLDWETDIYPVIAAKLHPLPKARIEIHLPKH